MIAIRPMTTAADESEVRRLFREFAASLSGHLDPAEVEQELAELTHRYAAPDACILLAFSGQNAAGCVAMKRADARSCELTRFYVSPDCRGRGIGRALVQALIEQARRAGYRRMTLVTASFMTAAVAVYESLGFVETNPLAVNPASGVRCLEQAI